MFAVRTSDLAAAQAKLREVSGWAGHQCRLHADPDGGLFKDGSAEAVERLDALLGGAASTSAAPSMPTARLSRGRRDGRR